MKLRKKTLLTISVIIFSLLLSLYVSSESIVLKSFIELERQDTHQNVQRALNALFDELAKLNRTNGDWAAWDATYAFAGGANNTYINDNLMDSTFTNLGLNLMLFLDTSGQILFGKAFDLQNEQALLVPASIPEHLANSAAFLHYSNPKSSWTGVFLLPEGPLLLSSRPIVTSNNEGPPRGTLLMGRYLDEPEIRHLAEITRLALTIFRVDDAQLPQDLQHVRSKLSEKTPIVSQPLDANSIAGYTLVTDIYGQPGLFLRVALPRSIYQQGQASVRYFLYALFTASLLFGLVMMELLDRIVLSRLTQLSQKVSRIHTSHDLSTRVTVPGKDELADLADTINAMLAALQQSQAALRQSEARFRGLSEATFEGILIHDQGRILDVNQALLQMFDWQYAELLEQNEGALFTPETREAALFHSRNGSEKPYEAEGRRKNGATFPVEIHEKAMPYQGRNVKVAALRDITERKQAEASLKESARRLQTIIETVGEGITLSDRTGYFEIFNPMMETLIGYTQEEVNQHGDLLQLLQPDSAEPQKTLAKIRASIQTGRSRNLEMTIRAKNGTFKTLLISSSLMGYQGRNWFLNVYHDITDRKQIEETLRENQQWFAAILKSISEAVLTIDTKGMLTFMNPAAETLTGWKSNAALGKEIGFKIIGEDRSSPLGKLAPETGSCELVMDVTQQPFLLSHEGVRIPVEYSGAAIKDDNANIAGFVLIIKNITERQRAEEERLRLEARLRQAQKMEAIGTLAGGIAHDFNNILGTMLGYTDLLLKTHAKPGRERTFLEEVRRAGERAADLVRQILTFSRVQQAEFKPLYLTPLIKETLAMLRATLPTNIEIQPCLAPACHRILADATQIHQVLLNLCTNAYHAMLNSGGILAVSLEEIVCTADQLPTPELAAGTYLKLTVRDTGHGMTPAVQQRIFDPFFTTKEVGKGTGLGLAVVHGIVKGHQGAILVESEPQQGTTFHLFFPIFEGPLADPPVAAATVPQGQERILIVEDEQALAQYYALALQGFGYHVTVAVNGDEALNVFRAHAAQFDLVFTDQSMPHMTGTQLSQELLKLRPELPIILATGYSDAISENEALAMGIRRFLMKPVKMTTFPQIIREIKEKR